MASERSRKAKKQVTASTPSEQNSFSSSGEYKTARETIHPRITSVEKSDGITLAKTRNERINTLWSTVISNGLPVTAALTLSDENGRYGSWTGKELAQRNRALVDQLIAFQIHYGEIPSSFELIKLIFQQGQLPATHPLSPSYHEPSKNEMERDLTSTEIYEAAIDKNAVQDMAEQGFGSLDLEADE